MKNNSFDPAPISRPLPDLTGELLTALDHIILSIVKLDLDSGEALLLHSRGQEDRRGCAFVWTDFLAFCRQLIRPEEAEKLTEVISIPHLREFLLAGHPYSRINLACRPETGLDWLEISAYLDQDAGAAYLLLRQSGDNYMLHRIIDLYVYNNCDCFYCLDAENNCCTRFNGKRDTPLPPAVCTDYSAEIVAYAEQYVVPEDRQLVIREMCLDRVLSALEHHDVHTFTFGMWNKDGTYTRKQMEYRYFDHSRQKILLTRTDITALYEEQQRYTRELETALLRAQSDPLTGLWSSPGILKAVERGLEVPGRQSALFFLDLDDFKLINDTYGHSTGDHALQTVAEVLRQNIGEGDHAARIGGDEFVVFLSSIPSREAAEDCAHRICSQLAAVQLEQAGLRISGSIGVAIAPQDGTDYETLVKTADRKAYRAKSNGKNQFVI